MKLRMLIALLILGAIGYFVYRALSEEQEWESCISDTPIAPPGEGSQSPT